MAGFRTRLDELRDYINLFKELDNPERLFIEIEADTLSNINTVKQFVLDEIETFSSKLIVATMCNIFIQFAHDMVVPLFEFDKSLFANNFQTAVNEVNINHPQVVAFERTLKIIDEFKNIEMIIIGCRAVYNVVFSGEGEKQDKYNKLLIKLNDLHSRPEYDELSDQTKNELEELLSSLKESNAH